MTISVDEEGEVSMITEDGSSSDEVVFTPGTAVNITNPLNGELTQIKSVILSPSSLQTLATGQESGKSKLGIFFLRVSTCTQTSAKRTLFCQSWRTRFLCVWMTTMNPRRFVLSSDGTEIRRGNSIKKMKKNNQHGSLTSLPFAGKLHFQQQHKINNCEKYAVINHLFF